MSKTRCPNCDSVISIDRPREGVTIICSSCAVVLEIVSTDPFRVDFPFDEVWDDGWEEVEGYRVF